MVEHPLILFSYNLFEDFICNRKDSDWSKILF